MNENILHKLKSIQSENYTKKFNIAREIAQESILYSLSKTDFFKRAAFHGGTALRIIHGISRYSEDLDFMLKKPEPFLWNPYLEAVEYEMNKAGFKIETLDKSKDDNPVKKAFIKESALCSVINVSWDYAQMRGKPPLSLRIKTEIDINPPQYSKFITEKIKFPEVSSITIQDLPSLFASKSHALLCRPYVKGRDWFDFEWYVSKKIEPNYKHLSAGINQNSQEQDQPVTANRKWYANSLREKINSINWIEASNDTKQFLNADEREQISKWNTDYFQKVVDAFEKNCISLDKKRGFDMGR